MGTKVALCRELPMAPNRKLPFTLEICVWFCYAFYAYMVEWDLYYGNINTVY